MRRFPQATPLLLFVALGCGQPTPSGTPSAGAVASSSETVLQDDTKPAADADTVPINETTKFNLTDFDVFPESDASSWAEAETIACAGNEKGYIYSKRPVSEGTISFEYRFPSDLAEDVIPNTGLLLMIESPHKKWPRCIEAQGKQSEAGQLKGNGGVADLNPKFDDDALQSAIKPAGEWNKVDVSVQADGVVARWNDMQTARCELGGLAAGPFGLQSEGNPVEFRNIVFTPATATD